MHNSEHIIEQAKKALGHDVISCLEELFQSLDSFPPCVYTKRYRADNAKGMDNLDYLEHELQLIYRRSIDHKECYFLKPYTIPLIDQKLAHNLLKNMRDLYAVLQKIYKDRLDERISVKEIQNLSSLDNNEILEPLFYLSESHNIKSSNSHGFPFEESAYLMLSEKILIKNDFRDILAEGLQWHILDKANLPIQLPDKKPHSQAGRPSKADKIEAAFQKLSEADKINKEDSIQSHYSQIRDCIALLHPADDDKGLSDEAIRRVITKYFE